MTQRRVKFHGKNDLSSSLYLPKMKTIVDKFIENNLFIESVEDAIEVKNIIKYIDAEVYLLEWTIEYINKLKEIKLGLEQSVLNFFGAITESEILDAMATIPFEYREDFFELFSTYKLDK